MTRTETVTIAGVELTVTGDWTKARAGCYYLNNGDPGYPDEPEDFEIESVMLGDLDVTDFADPWSEEIIEAVLAEISDVEEEMEE